MEDDILNTAEQNKPGRRESLPEQKRIRSRSGTESNPSRSLLGGEKDSPPFGVGGEQI